MSVLRYSQRQIINVGMSAVTVMCRAGADVEESLTRIGRAVDCGADFIMIELMRDSNGYYLACEDTNKAKELVRLETVLKAVKPTAGLVLACRVVQEDVAEELLRTAKLYGMGDRIILSGVDAASSDTVQWSDFGCNEPIPAGNTEELSKLISQREKNILTDSPEAAIKLRSELQGGCAENGLLPLNSIEAVIRSAAEIMLSADSKRLGVKQKSGTANFVTEYDVRVQKYLQGELPKLLPGCTFLAEEDGESSNPLSEGYTFIIDPIDGTTNFMLGRRESCISVGLVKGGKPLYGAVYDPYEDRFYSAYSGMGAYCNGRRVYVSEREAATGIALLGTSPYTKDRTGRQVAEITYSLLMSFGDIRRGGSAAIDLCSIACGEADVFCEPQLSPWDYAASALIITEAGGRVTNFRGEELPFDKPDSVLAATARVHEKALEVIKNI